MNNSTTRGSISVAAYSRDKDLERCLKAIIAAKRDRQIPLIVVHQSGYEKVTAVIEKYKESIDILVNTDAQANSKLGNINMNAILARQIAFNWLRSDWTLCVEEDVQIAPDAIAFIEYSYKKYAKNKFFRGVNLGSHEMYRPEKESTYNLVSYGMHGQAAMITSKTWAHFNITKILKKIEISGLDSLMEHYLKSGFMCTPHNSRYLDFGWEGTHASSNPSDIYYKKLRESHTKITSGIILKYKREKYPINWRSDALEFSYWLALPRFAICKTQYIINLLRIRVQTNFSIEERLETS